MRCYRCNAEMPDSAMICPRCGSPAHQSVAATYSYLPAGTPPWPTTIPQRSSQSPAPPPDIQPARRTRRSAGKILLTLAIVILTPLIGIGATLGILYSQGQFPARAVAKIPSTHIASTTTLTPTPQAGSNATNQLPNPTSFKKTSSADLNVSVKYPSDWTAATPQKSSSTGSVSQDISSQNLGIDFSIIRFASSLNSQITGPNDINQNYLSNLNSTQGVTNLQVASAQQTTIAGIQWTETDGVFTNSAGSKIHVAILSVQHNKVYYSILVVIPEAYHDEAIQKYIQPMFDSFQFLS